MEYSSIQDWIDNNSIRVVRQGQRNFFVETDVAASVGTASLRPGQFRLALTDFDRILMGGDRVICLTAGGLQKMYASTSGKLDIDGGMSLVELNASCLANAQSDRIALPEPALEYESPIQQALTPYLSSLISPNNSIMVTPELATILLGGNLKNRPRNKRNFKKLCAQLRAGKWKVNGATITLSLDWRLLDGQHRLFAIVETGIPAPCIIGCGFDPAVFATLDQGAKRTNADSLSIAGFPNSKFLASSIGVYQAVKNGEVVNNKSRAMPPEECIRFAIATPYIENAVEQARDYRRRGARFVPDAIIGGLMARGMEIDKRTTKKFFDYLLNDNCRGVRPATIQKLRMKLMNDSMDKTRSGNATFIAAIIIKTWNAYRAGKSVGVLKYRPEAVVDGIACGEPYPVMA